MLVLGIVGWSGSGKTTLIARLVPHLVGQGLRIATIKHAHHEFDIDQPGKDSFEHRKAGASEVIVSSSRRWAQIHENTAGREATLAELLQRLSPTDLVLVEGFKRDRHVRMEVFRPELGKPALFSEDKGIVAVATDRMLSVPCRRVVDLNDIPAVAACVLECATPVENFPAPLAAEDARMEQADRVNRPSYEF